MDGEAHTRVIWRIDQPWRDLRCDITSAAQVTVMTFCSLYLIDTASGTALRRPGPLAVGLTGDNEPFTFVDLSVATPCGLVVDRDGPTWRASTPLALVLEGLWPDGDVAEAIDFGQWLMAQEGSDTAWVPTHDGDCGALNCPLRCRPDLVQRSTPLPSGACCRRP